MEATESISSGGKLFARVVRSEWMPQETTFLSDTHQNFQLGAFVYGEGHEVPKHFHQPLSRTIEGTQEFLVVRKGSCEVDIYDDEQKLIRTLLLRAGDAILFFAGGHGFRVLEDTVFLDLKQGPYPGPSEKKRF